MKKILGTLLVASAMASLTFAQTSVVKTGTAGLIKDGFIDNLAFGDEENDKAILFFGTNASSVQAGWGKNFTDSLWLSFYDDYKFSGSSSDTQSVTHTYGTADGVNIDYVDTEKEDTVGTNTISFVNDFRVGIALNKTLGFQPYWKANWTLRETIPTVTAGAAVSATTTTVKTESSETATGTNDGTEYSDWKNHTNTNTFGVNFKGIETPKFLGDKELYVALNEVRAAWYDNHKSANYSSYTRVNGSTTNSVSAEGENTEGSYIKPGVNFELGMKLGNLGPAKVSLTVEDDFEMGFDLSESTSSYTDVKEDSLTKTTVSTSYEKSYGDYTNWKNKLTPKFDFDLDLDERLTLKSRASFALGFAKSFNGGDTYEQVVTTTIYDKISSTKNVATVRTKNSDSTQDVDTFTTTLDPEFDFGVVFKAVPDRLNINFGAVVKTGTFTWTKTDRTNTNENKVVTSSYKDELGNTTSTTTVTVNNGSAETSNLTFNNAATSAAIYLGATWFFSPDVKMDVFYANGATAFFNTTNTFGIDFAIRY